MQNGSGKGAMGFGKSRAKLLNEKQGRVTFDDVAGIDEAREELTEIVDFLKDPAKFHRLGGRSEEHTSELQSLMRISYAVLCMNKNTQAIQRHSTCTNK